MIPRLGESEPAVAGLRRLAGDCIDAALAALEGVAIGDAAIHTVRKQSKQARALLRLFKCALGTVSAEEVRFFRDLSRSLSAARDARVVLDVHAMLVGIYGELLDPAICAGVRNLLLSQFGAVAPPGAAALPAGYDCLRAELTAVRHRVHAWTADEAEQSSLERGFLRAYRRARRAARLASESARSEDLHELRKCAKDYWYQLEFLAERWPHAVPRRIASARRLTELLGDAHDLAVYRQALSGAPADWNPKAAELFAALADQRARRLHDEAIGMADEVFAARPKRLAQEIELPEQWRRAAG
jgi:CHAD domain-containing protein